MFSLSLPNMLSLFAAVRLSGSCSDVGVLLLFLQQWKCLTQKYTLWWTVMSDNASDLCGFLIFFWHILYAAQALLQSKRWEVYSYLKKFPFTKILFKLFVHSFQQPVRKHLLLRAAVRTLILLMLFAVGGKCAAEVMGHVVLFWLTHRCFSVTALNLFGCFWIIFWQKFTPFFQHIGRH